LERKNMSLPQRTTELDVAVMKEIIMECPVLKKKVKAKFSSAYGDSWECELCGEHGKVTMDVDCKCGKTHTIWLNSW
jgi:hypothetical protein